jgi:hypothetical protein
MLREGLRAVGVVKHFAPSCRVAVEALGLNRWFVNARREAGIDVLVCDARRLGLRKLGRKTDWRDAQEIAPGARPRTDRPRGGQGRALVSVLPRRADRTHPNPRSAAMVAQPLAYNLRITPL